MHVLGYPFIHVTNIAPVQLSDGTIKQFMPQERYANVANLPLNKYGAGPFCKFTIPKDYRTCGVYLMICGEEIRYIGECVNLSARFNAGYGNISPRNCFKGGQETNCRLNSLVYLSTCGGETLHLFFYQTENFKEAEAQLRASQRAPWNKV
ncbi:hypothetical protein ACS3SW_01880 [Roseobacteraceae bacterium S113]